MERKIVIGITQGDINGIGYEVILKHFPEKPECSIPLFLLFMVRLKVAAFHRKQLDIQGIFEYNQQCWRAKSKE